MKLLLTYDWWKQLHLVFLLSLVMCSELLYIPMEALCETLNSSWPCYVISYSIVTPHSIASANQGCAMARQFIPGLSPQRSSFISRPFCLGFMVGRMTLGQVFLWVVWFSPFSIILWIFHIHLFIYHWCYTILVTELLSNTNTLSISAKLNGEQICFGIIVTTIGYKILLGVKQPGHGIDHTPPDNAEVKERVELYLYSVSGPSWSVIQ